MFDHVESVITGAICSFFIVVSYSEDFEICTFSQSLSHIMVYPDIPMAP